MPRSNGTGRIRYSSSAPGSTSSRASSCPTQRKIAALCNDHDNVDPLPSAEGNADPSHDGQIGVWIDRAEVSYREVGRGRRHHAAGAELQLGVDAEDQGEVGDVAHRHAHADADRRIGAETPVLPEESLAGGVHFGALQGLGPAIECNAAVDVEQKAGCSRTLCNRYSDSKQERDLIEFRDGAGAEIASEEAGVLKGLHEGLRGEA